MQPILFLLNPNFADAKVHDSHLYYCPHCAMIEGVLHYYPDLRTLIDIRYVDFPRPRPAIIELIGEENQGCPVLILPRDSVIPNGFKAIGAYMFSDEKMVIATYLAEHFHIGFWHP